MWQQRAKSHPPITPASTLVKLIPTYIHAEIWPQGNESDNEDDVDPGEIE